MSVVTYDDLSTVLTFPVTFAIAIIEVMKFILDQIFVQSESYSPKAARSGKNGSRSNKFPTEKAGANRKRSGTGQGYYIFSTE